MLENCFRFAPRDSIPGLITKICKYLKDHPGWSEEELEDQIKKFVGATGVESFNGRTGSVTLSENDVNNLKIASAYFAGDDETINSLNLVSLYDQGVRFVFTDFNSVTSGYNLSFVLEYSESTGKVVYYPMATGSGGGGGNIVSVNGKTGVVELGLHDILGDSSAQVKLCTLAEFTSTAAETWNAYYNDGYRIVGVANSSASAIDSIYILKQGENDHAPIGLSAGASNAYTPDNPPPYPVDSVNAKTGTVELKVVDVSSGNSTDENAYIFIDELEDYPDVVAANSDKLGGQPPAYYATADDVAQLNNEKANKTLISDAWQSGRTYSAGAYCIYNNNLYKAKVQTLANPTSESDWELIELTGEFANLYGALSPVTRLKDLAVYRTSGGDTPTVTVEFNDKFPSYNLAYVTFAIIGENYMSYGRVGKIANLGTSQVTASYSTNNNTATFTLGSFPNVALLLFIRDAEYYIKSITEA